MELHVVQGKCVLMVVVLKKNPILVYQFREVGVIGKLVDAPHDVVLVSGNIPDIVTIQCLHTVVIIVLEEEYESNIATSKNATPKKLI